MSIPKRVKKGILMSPNELQTVLMELGWSQAELSRRVNVHPNTVTRWMRVGCSGPEVGYLKLRVHLKRMEEI